MFYNLLIIFSTLSCLLVYFKLIVKQIEGFVPESELIGMGVLVTLILLTIFMSYLRLGERLIAFGILSTVAYICFLIWAYSTASYEPKKLPAVGPKYVDLGASLMMGYSIHGFYIQYLFKTTTKDKFTKILIAVFIAGFLIYTFISYSGYAIINREPRTP